MARWNGDAEWHDGTLEELELRQYIPMADYAQECCFIAIARALAGEHPRPC